MSDERDTKNYPTKTNANASARDVGTLAKNRDSNARNASSKRTRRESRSQFVHKGSALETRACARVT